VRAGRRPRRETAPATPDGTPVEATAPTEALRTDGAADKADEATDQTDETSPAGAPQGEAVTSEAAPEATEPAARGARSPKARSPRTRARKAGAPETGATPAEEPAAETSTVDEAAPVQQALPISDAVTPDTQIAAEAPVDATPEESAEVLVVIPIDENGEPADLRVEPDTNAAPESELVPPAGSSGAAQGTEIPGPAQAAAGVEVPVSERYVETDLYAEPAPYEPPVLAPVDDPAVRLRLARVHLRTGSLALARSEFESLNGGGQLDIDGQLALAEVRWRTGEVHAAGEAAQAYLSGGGSELLGFIIAAEGHAYDARHAEAQALVAEALERTINGVDTLFAGIRQRADWSAARPSMVAEPPVAMGAEFAGEPAVAPKRFVPAPPPAAPEPEIPAAVAEPEIAAALAEPEIAAAAAPEPEAPAAPEPEIAAAVALEPEAPAAPEPEIAAAVALEPEAPAAPEPEAVPAMEAPVTQPWDEEIAAATEALGSNDPLVAGLHLAMALRTSPGAARAVLDTIGDSTDMALEMVRIEATRLLGETTPVETTETATAAEPPPVEPAPAEPVTDSGADLPKINWGD
jgi:hypothetical protein